MVGLTDWHLSRDTPRKSFGVPARPQAAATGMRYLLLPPTTDSSLPIAGAAVNSAKCKDVTNPDKEENVLPIKNTSDEELQHWVDLIRKQKPEHLFDDDVIRRLTKFKATTADTLKATVPQSVVGAQSRIHDHGPGDDSGPEEVTPGKKYVRAAPAGSVLKENVKNAQKLERKRPGG